MADTFDVFVRICIRQIINQGRSHQAFQQTHNRNGKRHREDDLQRLKRQRNVGQQEDRKGIGQLAHVAHNTHIKPHEHRKRCQHNNRHQRRWNGCGHVWEQINNRQTRRRHHIRQRVYTSCCGVQFRQLRKENKDRQRIHKTCHHRFGNKAHHTAQLKHTRTDLDQTCQNRGRQQIFQTVIAHQRHHQNSGRGGGSTDHTGAAACDRGNHRNAERGIETDLRINARNDRKRNRLGDQRKRHHKARKQIIADVAKPIVAKVRYVIRQHLYVSSVGVRLDVTGALRDAYPPPHIRSFVTKDVIQCVRPIAT